MNDPWPKGLSSARVGSLVKRTLHIGEFGKLFLSDRIGIITAITEEDICIIYDVLFFNSVDDRKSDLHTLRLLDEDLMLIKP